MLRMNEFAISLNVFEKEQCFVIFFSCYFFFTCTESSYFQEHFTFVTAVSLENLDMSNRKVVIRTYKGSTVAGLARRTSEEGVLISPSTINLESFDIDIKFFKKVYSEISMSKLVREKRFSK